MTSGTDNRSDGFDDALDQGAAAFERRARELLRDSVEGLPAHTRSRLTRARHAALATRPPWYAGSLRRWVPAGAGALAAATLAVLFMVGPRGESPGANVLATAGPEDLEMLADSDAVQLVQLGRDEDVDYDFYEWAASEAKGGSAPAIGT
jgi:hypothetical protein